LYVLVKMAAENDEIKIDLHELKDAR